MQCPVCNVPLLRSERLGIEIDSCPKCRGVWLDRGELDKIVDRSFDEFSPVQPPRPAAPPAQEPAAAAGRRRGFLAELFDREAR